MDKRQKLVKHASFAKDLTSILVKNKVIVEKEAHRLEKSFKASAKDYFDDFLLEEGLVDRESLLKALSGYFQVPAVDVQGYFFQSFLLQKFPKGVMHRYVFIPMDVDEDIMTIVAGDPDDPDLLPTIGEYVSYNIVINVGLRRDITDAITDYYDVAVTEVPGDIDLRRERFDERGAHREEFVKQEEDEFPIEDEDVLD